MQKIILLSGYSGAGKDTVADILVEHHGYLKLALAGPIKTGLASVTDLTLEQIEVLKNNPDSQVRLALQTLGQVACEVDPLHWCKMVSARINGSFIEKFVISDVRKVTEAEYFEDHFPLTLLWGIYRDSINLSLPKFQHQVELEVPLLREMADDMLDNNGTLEDLRGEVRAII